MIRRMTFGVRVAAAAALVLTGTGMAASATADATSESVQDEAWLVAAHQSHLARIAAGKAAQEKAVSDDVKAMGERLVAEHTEMDERVKELAAKYEVTLPTEPDVTQKSNAARVAKEKGEAYDKAWVLGQMKGHELTDAARARQDSGGQASDVVAAAEDAEPVLDEHMEQLTALAADLGVAPPATGEDSAAGADEQAGDDGSSSFLMMAMIGLAVVLLGVVAFLLGRRRSTAGS